MQGYRQRVLECPAILKDTVKKKLYLRRLRRKAGEARLEPLENLLEVVAYNMGPRFTFLNMDYIQRLKQDALASQDMVDNKEGASKSPRAYLGLNQITNLSR